jgi:trans-aconitate 2-methyltransferase
MWDPTTYEHFSSPRLRPALELLARVPLDTAATVVDLGCGTGVMFEALRQRFPAARLVGVDSSEAMLAKAHGADELVFADAAEWAPEHPVDLLYSNAALHWLDNHRERFPRLVERVRTGGVLAVQMPRNHDRPSHRLIADVIRNGDWRDRLEPILRSREYPVHSPQEYYDILHRYVTTIDLWEVDYIHRLEGVNPVAEWTKGSALRPFLTALPPEEADEFFDAYQRQIAVAYPVQADGSTLLSFRRLFFTATR